MYVTVFDEHMSNIVDTKADEFAVIADKLTDCLDRNSRLPHPQEIATGFLR